LPKLNAKWHQTLAKVVDRDFNDDAIGELLRGLEALIGCSPGMVLRYPKGKNAKITHERLLADDVKSHHVDLYEEGAYLLDPYYRAAIDNQLEGVFGVNEVAPAGFEESEYFNLYYQQAELLDEICFIFKAEHDALVSISLARRQGTQKFSQDDLALLKNIEPLVKSILLKWSAGLDNDVVNLEQHLDCALKNFGSSLLTPKECEIVFLLLHGHSMKSVAERLNNSQETIKHHRKNIYSKLDIGSQSELFYLFIDSVRNSNGHMDEDPLTDYNS